MQKITPFLWFDTNAEEAANFYVSVFKNSKITNTTKYSDSSAKASGMPSDSVMTVSFELDGQEFTALNGGPVFKFTPAISLVVSCKDQSEIDYFWEKLSEGGEPNQCGWLADKFGVSWQIVPDEIGEIMSSGDPEKSERATKALMEMTKIYISKLKS